MFPINVAEESKTHIYVPKFYPENPAVYEIKWKNVLQTDGPQMITRWCAEKMGFVCLITKPRTKTHSHNI
jgi:hypothetical protein